MSLVSKFAKIALTFGQHQHVRGNFKLSNVFSSFYIYIRLSLGLREWIVIVIDPTLKRLENYDDFGRSTKISKKKAIQQLEEVTGHPERSGLSLSILDSDARVVKPVADLKSSTEAREAQTLQTQSNIFYKKKIQISSCNLKHYTRNKLKVQIQESK